MTHIAFDLGLKTSGVATPHGSDHHTCPAGRTGGDRLAWWESTFLNVLLPYPKGTIVVEAPIVYPKRAQATIGLAKLHGVLELTAHRQGYDYVTVAPAKLKKWATGNGSCNKAGMEKAAWQMGWRGTDDNEADAWLLWFMYDKGAAA